MGYIIHRDMHWQLKKQLYKGLPNYVIPLDSEFSSMQLEIKYRKITTIQKKDS